MQYRKLGKSDLHVSVVGLGTMSWPGCNYGDSGYAPTPGDFNAARAMVQAALDAGINLFDTAEGYGRGLAEEILGQTLEELGCREKAIIVTKVGPLFGEEQINGRTCNLSAEHIAERCELSLKRLRTDHIDLYLAHWPDPLTPVEETMQAADKLKQQGKIRWFGVSNFPNDLLGAALRHGVIAANQLPYSLADRTIDADKRPFCLENEVGIMAYSPLGKGVLSGKYDAQHLPPADDYRRHRKYFAKENLPQVPRIGGAFTRTRTAILLHPRSTRPGLGPRSARDYGRPPRREIPRPNPRQRRSKRSFPHGRSDRGTR